jgi:NitT/TauT family transport system ATP-binding protein
MGLPAPQAKNSRMTRPVLVITSLCKSYVIDNAEHRVLADISLEAREGEFLCIVGPSGAGKTTLLRCIAGLISPSSGTVTLDGSTVTEPPEKLGVVFQDYSRSLMPWLTVAGNVMLPLHSKPYSTRERSARVTNALHAVGLDGCHTKYPWQISGGMQQRVAIARALAFEPKALLMDEPFASVDAQTRFDLEDLILQVRDEFGVTVALVTHDIDEAVYLGDKVVVLGGAPTGVRECIAVGLPFPRDQLTTKALPTYAQARQRVMTLIRADPPETHASESRPEIR